MAKKGGKTRPRRALVRAGRRPPVPLVLLLILLVASALRLWRIDSAIGGFHDHNEANYTLMAKNFSHSSLLFPNPDGHLFLETPPFYAYVLALVFRVTGVSVLAARIVTIAASLGLIVSTFLLGRRLFGETAGLAAALLTAVSPLAVLTGRNIQTDSLLLFLLVTAFFFYLRAETGSGTDWFRFGLFLGLAIFTKLFAVVGLIALVLWELAANRGRAFSNKGFWKALAVAAAVPLAFYGFHAFRDFAYLRRELTGGAAASTTFPSSSLEWSGMGLEALWAFSPAVTLWLIAGVVAAVWRRSREELFVLFPAAGFATLYLFVHKHSYYLLTMLPFGALLAGRLAAGMKTRGLRIALLGVTAVTGVFFSLVDLASMKLGFTEFAEFGRVAAELPGSTHRLLIGRELLDSHGTVLYFYDPRARLVTLEDLPVGSDGALSLPEGADPSALLSFVPPQARPLPAGWLLSRERYGLELFGWTFAEAHANPHFFRQGRYVRDHTGGLIDFGFRSLRTYPALALVPIPAGVRLVPTPEGLAIKPGGPAP